MRRRRASVVVVCFAWSLLGGVPSARLRAEEAPLLDLTACVNGALQHNPGLVSAEDELAINRARRRVATASLLPAVTVKADETLGRADDAAESSPFTQRSYGVQVTQSLFAGGKLMGTRRQARLGVEVAELQLEKQRLEVRHAATESFWRLVALENVRSVHADTQRQLQDDLEKAARHELGAARSARIEILSTRAQMRESEAALAEAEEELIQARIALRDALGRRTGGDVPVAREIPTGIADVSEEAALRMARTHRPDVKIAERLIESARLARWVGRSGYFPKVDLNGFYGRSGAAYVDTNPFELKKDWNAGVSATWPLFGNGLKYSAFRERTSPKLGESSRTETNSQSLSLTLGDALSIGVTNRESRKGWHEEEWRYDKARRDADEEVRLAVRRCETALRRLETARAKAEESAQAFKDTRSLLQDDRAHLGDLASARNRVAFARAGFFQAQANYLIALSSLNKTVGVVDGFRLEGK